MILIISTGYLAFHIMKKRTIKTQLTSSQKRLGLLTQFSDELDLDPDSDEADEFAECLSGSVPASDRIATRVLLVYTVSFPLSAARFPNKAHPQYKKHFFQLSHVGEWGGLAAKPSLLLCLLGPRPLSLI